MKLAAALIVFAGITILGAIVVIHYSRVPPTPGTPQTNGGAIFVPAESPIQLSTSTNQPVLHETRRRTGPVPRATTSPSLTNKLERLAQIRETFHSLAAGNPAVALHAAKEIPDPTERETALLTLVTEWTHGELRTPTERAEAISLYGLEAGLGMELVKNPEQALLWANEITDGPGRAALIQQTAIALTTSDPASAFALSDQLPDAERRKFSDAVFAGWAAHDTGAALDWANQLSDPGEREAATQAIRSSAPVGIGAALRMQDGYAVINQILPGTPAEISGQLHVGDRIVAMAQGNESFIDAQGMTLKDIVDRVRGAPGSVLQLQILPADALPGSPPQTIAIVRDQIKFKR